jgi:hypothetical protein
VVAHGAGVVGSHINAERAESARAVGRHSVGRVRRERSRVARGRRPPSPSEQAFTYAVAGLVVVALLKVGSMATAPWQADHAYAQALIARNRLVSDPQSTPQASARLSRRIFTALHSAQMLNPWEPRYLRLSR